MLIKVTDSKYIRDTNSMGLINTDESSKEEYFTRAKLLKNQRKEMQEINTEITSLKDDIQDIKSMLIQILSDKK